jgi:hypothetical protein
MRHYEESRWVDYVRGLADANAHQELKSHLEAGCPECSTTMELFRKVAKAAAHEIEHEPPEYAVHSVKAYFALQQTERQPASVRFLGLKLAFDSLAEPVGAGIRSLGGESRQLVYYANLSGELGDFHLTCSREKTMRLRMLVDKDELIEVDLDWPQDLEPVEADESAG